MPIAELVRGLVGPELPIAVRAYDGSADEPPDSVATLVLRRPGAIQRFLTAPGELGLGRAYVAGDADIEGDAFAAIRAIAAARRSVDPRLVAKLIAAVGPSTLRHRLPPPPEEVHLTGWRHSRARDAAAVNHHYSVSNDFYRIVLGPSLTYSCAVWTSPDITLEQAQYNKYELVARKLGLQAGMRLLDVGCGWGGMVLHAAEHHGVRAVGITLSHRQAELATKRVAEAGLTDRVEIRLQDERDVDDGPFDAISSIGMFEHVGRQRLHDYFSHLYELLVPGGRLLNHGICRPPNADDRRIVHRPVSPIGVRRTFIDRFVFPDGELHEVGTVVSALQQEGFELRHLESLREHYALTLRAWVTNLLAGWDEAVAESSEGRARVWRMYMTAAAVNFEEGRTHVHQALAVKADGGRSGLRLRPHFDSD